MLTVTYTISEAIDSDFLVYIDFEGEFLLDLLPTLPTVYLMIEFAFNMIPIDWPMLIFVELLFSLYMFLNFFAVSLSTARVNVYDAFDWYNSPWLAIAALFACYAMLAAIFAFFWLITSKCKLPSYNKKIEDRYSVMHVQSVADSTDLDNLTERSNSFRTKKSINLSQR